MIRGQAIAAIVLVGTVLAFAARDASAQKVYKWTDKDGKVHFSNVAPSGEATTDDTSSVKGVEAQSPETAPPAAEAPAVTAEAPEVAPAEKPSAETGPSDEQFSADVSATRLRLKRELAQAKQESQEIGDKLAAIKKERDQPQRVGLEMLQKAYGPDQHEGTQEDDLRKEKAKTDQRIDAIRKQYSDLRDQAVKRYGHVPGWWLPIE
jgi:Domain of unknown function (DUF4124)